MENIVKVLRCQRKWKDGAYKYSCNRKASVKFTNLHNGVIENLCPEHAKNSRKKLNYIKNHKNPNHKGYKEDKL